MKESIDLTENRAFREQQNMINQGTLPRKRVPWKKAKPDELAERTTNITTYTTSITGWSSDDNWINNRINQTTTSNSINMTMSNFLFTWNDDLTLYNYYKNGSITTYSSTQDRKDYSTFPTGKRDDIKLYRRLLECHRGTKETKICRCGGKITRTPWSDKNRCNTCVEKEQSRAISKYKKILVKESMKQDVMMSPCLSREIPMQSVKKKFPKRYKEWDYNDDYRYDHWTSNRKEEYRRKKYVYYKNRELRRREEPWQPNGRVPQEYDEMFESTNWRDMLKKRIGTLERDEIFKKEDKYSTLININFTISGDSWINISMLQNEIERIAL